MAKCKYLSDIGVSDDDIVANYCSEDDDPRQERWIKQREEYGFDDRETWSLDITIFQFLYTRLMMYKEIGGQVVDLSYHKFNYDGNEVSLGDAINIIINECKRMIQAEFLNRTRFDPKIWTLLGDIMPALWW